MTTATHQQNGQHGVMRTATTEPGSPAHHSAFLLNIPLEPIDEVKIKRVGNIVNRGVIYYTWGMRASYLIIPFPFRDVARRPEMVVCRHPDSSRCTILGRLSA
jgi:hypothetical protein